MSLTTPPDASRAPSTRSPSCGKPGCGRPARARRLQAWGRRLQDRLGCRVLLGVLAEHAEQAAHLGQPGPGGVADRGEPLCARGGQPRRGRPAGLCLHRDHRDVVRDHVVQLAGDPGPLPACQVIGQHPLGFLAGGAVALALLARSPRHRGHRRERDRRRQQDREHPGLGGRRGQAGHGRHPHAPRGGPGQHQGEPEERCPQHDGEGQGPGSRQPVRGHQQRRRPRDRHQLEQRQRQRRRQVHRHRRGDRAEQSRRHGGQQAEPAHQQRGRHGHPGMADRCGQPGAHG